MKLLKKTEFGNPVLRKRSRKVSAKEMNEKSFIFLIKDMFFTMRKSKGVGLAAPQINKDLQLAVIEIKKNKLRPKVIPLAPEVIINPEITNHSKKITHDWEGCLSLTGVRGLVPRFSEVTVKYTDDTGKIKVKKLKGFQARVFQHEIDHLNGVLYVDRMKDMKSLITLNEFRKRSIKNEGLKSK